MTIHEHSALRTWLAISLLWIGASQAQDPASARYISDETAITLRENKGMDSPVTGLLTAGTRVELLESDSSSGYARVRVAPNREGWVLARYLSEQPAAKERLAKAEGQLAEQQARLQQLEIENRDLRAKLDAGSGEPMAGPAPDAPAQASTLTQLLTGAGLVIAGLLSGLLLSTITSGRARRRRSAHL
jgi:SH3 domain protein